MGGDGKQKGKHPYDFQDFHDFHLLASLALPLNIPVHRMVCFIIQEQQN